MFLQKLSRHVLINSWLPVSIPFGLQLLLLLLGEVGADRLLGGLIQPFDLLDSVAQSINGSCVNQGRSLNGSIDCSDHKFFVVPVD